MVKCARTVIPDCQEVEKRAEKGARKGSEKWIKKLTPRAEGSRGFLRLQKDIENAR